MPTTTQYKSANETDEQWKQRVGFYGSNTSVNSSNLAQTEDIKYPDPTPTKDPSPLAAASIETLIGAANASGKEEQQRDDIISQILTTQDVLSTEAQSRKKKEEEAGLPGQQQDLQNVVNQLQGLSKEALAIPLQLQEQIKGMGVTKGGLAPIQASELRKNAIKSLSLAAMGQTLQGNIALAQSTIRDAIEAEFAPAKARLETLKQLYSWNQDALERADKKRADTLNILISERERIIKTQEADRTLTYNIAMEAVRAGAPQSVAEEMRNTTPDKAMAIAAKYLGQDFKNKMEQQAFDNGLATREMVLKESQAGLDRRLKMLSLAQGGDAAAIKELGYDPSNLPLSTEDITSFEEQQNLMQRDIDIVNNLLSNEFGLEASGGLVRGGIAGALLESPLGPLGAVYSAAKKQDFLADAGYVLKNLTFKKMRELAEQGIKLTPISEKELKAMGDASDVLVSAADYDENGNLIGFKMSEEKIRTQLRLILKHYQSAKDDISVQLMLDASEMKEITNL